MDVIDDVAAWAWARHHNILSWYIRPRFLLPFCLFAYRRSLLGIGMPGVDFSRRGSLADAMLLRPLSGRAGGTPNVDCHSGVPELSMSSIG